MPPVNTPFSFPPTEFDPFDSINAPYVPPPLELWGMVEINAWACALVSGVGRVPYSDPALKRYTAIDIFVQSLPEQGITKPKQQECNMLYESDEWNKITLASINALGITDVRTLNGKWARIEKVNGKPYYEKVNGKYRKFDEFGKPVEPKGYERIFKFIALYNNEDECRAAYFANGGKTVEASAQANQVINGEETDRMTAIAFMNALVPNACKGKANMGEAIIAVKAMIESNPIISKHFSENSPEVIDLITKSFAV